MWLRFNMICVSYLEIGNGVRKIMLCDTKIEMVLIRNFQSKSDESYDESVLKTYGARQCKCSKTKFMKVKKETLLKRHLTDQHTNQRKCDEWPNEMVMLGWWCSIKGKI